MSENSKMVGVTDSDRAKKNRGKVGWDFSWGVKFGFANFPAFIGARFFCPPSVSVTEVWMYTEFGILVSCQ